MTYNQVMKIACSVLFLLSSASVALSSNELKVRLNVQEGSARIVFQSENEILVNDSKVFASYTLIKIVFPEDFLFQEPEFPGMIEFSKKGKSLFLNIKDLKSIKLLRLKSPPRLVLDVNLSGYSEPQVLNDRKSQEGQFPDTASEIGEAGEESKSVRTIMIDPGHGGHDLGIYSPNFSEKSIVFSVAKLLRYRLNKSKKRALLTRSQDRHVRIMDRIYLVRKKTPDLLISLHMTTSNHATIYTSVSRQLKDEEVYLLSFSQNPYMEESRLVAQEVNSSLMENLNMIVFSREYDLPLLSYVDCPSILIELPGADFFDYSKKNISHVVNSIIEGIIRYEKG
jgi:N-acetylmuramoyl-L-alanine amidase